jgi:hypothetical protein
LLSPNPKKRSSRNNHKRPAYDVHEAAEKSPSARIRSGHEFKFVAQDHVKLLTTPNEEKGGAVPQNPPNHTARNFRGSLLLALT